MCLKICIVVPKGCSALAKTSFFSSKKPFVLNLQKKLTRFTLLKRVSGLILNYLLVTPNNQEFV